MIDDIVRFYGGPNDGEAVKLPPDFQPLRADDSNAALLPPYIELKSGGRYQLERAKHRYEWVTEAR